MFRKNVNFTKILEQFHKATRNENAIKTYVVKRKKTTSAAKKEQTTPKAFKTPPILKSDEDVLFEETVTPAFLVQTIGSNRSRWLTTLKKHPELRSVKRKDLQSTVESLTNLNFSVEDVLQKPMILYTSGSTLINRHNVLEECGFSAITIPILAKYIAVVNRSVVTLKTYNYMPYDLDIIQRLLKLFTNSDYLDLELDENKYPCNEDMKLKEIRENILNAYLQQRVGMSEEDLGKLWKSYPRVRHKSFKSVQDVVQILTKEFNFSKERIIKNSYLLHGDAENIRRILTEIPTIDSHDIREIGYRRPKILMSSCDSLLKTLNYVKSFGIKEEAVSRCLEVLTLGPDTVLERLKELGEIEEFKVLGSNPRVLRLVHYHNKARLRLEYLNQLKVRCASLHILSCGSEAFAKFARDGSDRTKGRDIIVYLANVMSKNESLLRKMLSRHPNWCHTPVIHVKECLDYLVSKRFTIEQIFGNIHLLLYPIKRIQEKLAQLQSREYLDGMELEIEDIHSLSNNEILTLILYLIESEFHFTGDGIWTEQHTHHVENFNNLLPDFPESLNKVYKYGVQPAGSKKVEKMFV